jgi:hypothetical protein
MLLWQKPYMTFQWIMAFIVTGSLAIVGYIICMLIVENAIQCGGKYSHINASLDILWKDTLTFRNVTDVQEFFKVSFCHFTSLAFIIDVDDGY